MDEEQLQQVQDVLRMNVKPGKVIIIVCDEDEKGPVLQCSTWSIDSIRIAPAEAISGIVKKTIEHFDQLKQNRR
jgi:hypothetical protein